MVRTLAVNALIGISPRRGAGHLARTPARRWLRSSRGARHGPAGPRPARAGRRRSRSPAARPGWRPPGRSHGSPAPRSLSFPASRVRAPVRSRRAAPCHALTPATLTPAPLEDASEPSPSRKGPPSEVPAVGGQIVRSLAVSVHGGEPTPPSRPPPRSRRRPPRKPSFRNRCEKATHNVYRNDPIVRKSPKKSGNHLTTVPSAPQNST
jgi:hypothetical protein